jgi:EpsD family peptidyl-prolyl cis-trans isomerase
MVGLATKPRWNRQVALALAVAMAAGCGAGENRPSATQVIARVNDIEITVHQINAVLAQNPNLSPKDEAAAKREILNRLVDQQLAVQQAQLRKLDRSPNILQAVEAGRAEILARAYSEEIARAQPRPSLEEVKKYYAENPELFSQRREFVLESIGVAASEELGAELKSRVAKSGSIKAIAEWLRSRNASFAEIHGTRSAEEIPLQMLAKLHAMKDGEIQLFDEGGGRYQVIQVAATRPAPVDLATATPRIQQFLFNRGLYAAIDREMKQLRAAAKIEYLGEFAGANAAAGTALDPQVKDSPEPSQLHLRSIEKGVRGLR